MPGLDWLIARPIAHRGLHDKAAGVIENSASAITRALDGDYGIEVDLQITRDGEAMVFHDDALERLTQASGRVNAQAASELQAVSFKGTSDRMLRLDELLALVAGRTPLLLELKSHFNDDERLPARVVEVVRDYAGPIAAMSFDPFQVEQLRALAPGLPRGITAERSYRHPAWASVDPQRLRQMARFTHGLRTQPHFVAYSIADLPAFAPLFARYALGCRLLTWTVHTDKDRARAARYADQMIFEGFRP